MECWTLELIIKCDIQENSTLGRFISFGIDTVWLSLLIVTHRQSSLSQLGLPSPALVGLLLLLAFNCVISVIISDTAFASWMTVFAMLLVELRKITM